MRHKCLFVGMSFYEAKLLLCEANLPLNEAQLHLNEAQLPLCGAQLPLCGQNFFCEILIYALPRHIFS